jgi:hypothetical protein
VTFVGHVDDRPPQVLVALGDVVHRADQADVGDGELRVVAFAGVCRQIDQGDVGLGPRRAVTVEHLAVRALAEHVHCVRHLQQPHAAHLGQRRVLATGAQRVAHVARENGALFATTSTVAMFGGVEDALPD